MLYQNTEKGYSSRLHPLLQAEYRFATETIIGWTTHYNDGTNRPLCRQMVTIVDCWRKAAIEGEASCPKCHELVRGRGHWLDGWRTDG